tara:strand:- start:877 stop:1218 length:342 start_codon:yes stop_codon:yes gene_type:complete
MQKSLEQIQQENRKFILKAIHGCSYEEALKKEYAKKGNNTISVPLREYEGEELTLSRVLLAISKYRYCDVIWFDDELGTLEFDLKGVSFDLTKETLEEQTKETQRGLNEFFND